MGGPEMAPQTPQRSERPGTAGALLYTPLVEPRRSRGAPRCAARFLGWWRLFFQDFVEQSGQAGHRRLAVQPRHDLALAVDHDRVRRALEAVAVADGEPGIERDRIGDLVGAHEATDVNGRVLHVDGQHLDAARAITLGPPHEPRRPARAGF